MPPKPIAQFAQLKLAVVADNLTRLCLSYECRVRDVTPLNYRLLFSLWKPDLLLVESAWEGVRGKWRSKIADYPDHPRTNNRTLCTMVEAARDAAIPCVFWNREDAVHFERFINSARVFDAIFTVDANAIPRYQSIVGARVPVRPLMFPVQPAIHYPAEAGSMALRASFVGSYSRHIHPRRRIWQDMMFNAADALGVTVFDRNSHRSSANYRYPDLPWLDVRPSVSHTATADIYRSYLVNLNVNTIEDSPTMYSRRLVEILACGGFCVTNPTVAVERLFNDYCAVVHSVDQCRELFARLARDGLSAADRSRALAGAAYVLREHTWHHRLEEIMQVIG